MDKDDDTPRFPDAEGMPFGWSDEPANPLVIGVLATTAVVVASLMLVTCAGIGDDQEKAPVAPAPCVQAAQVMYTPTADEIGAEMIKAAKARAAQIRTERALVVVAPAP